MIDELTRYQRIFDAIAADPRYRANLDWGKPRSGHPEGTVRAHIAELERNLETLRSRLSELDACKLRILIHTHDTFKPNADTKAAILDPQSHASLARKFLAEFCEDADLLAMVQFHDEPYALWRQFRSKGSTNSQRFANLLAAIKDWNLFLPFAMIDGCTAGKSRDPLLWLFAEIAGKVETRWVPSDLV